MTSEERDDNYWMGVRDALRMVDSFLRWARKHPKDAKSIDDFLAEGLVAAAKRCESCLGKELGLKYGSKDPEVDEPREIKEPPHFEEPIPNAESEVEAVLQSIPDINAEEDTSVYVDDVPEPEMPSVEPVSIDEIEIVEIEEEPMSSEDLEFEGLKRDFLSDFPLSEPEPIVDDSDDAALTPTTPEDVMRSVLREEALHPSEYDSKDASTPEDEDIVVETYDDVLELLESPSEPIEESPPPATIPKRDLWSPYDEPPLHEDEIDEDELEDEIVSNEDEDEVSSEDSDTPQYDVKPPPPPPPPETDETEEERRRRARRLFFGT